jgi:FAD dependent oxidoreductase
VIGLATALAAQDRGARVTVLEAEAPGAEGSAGPGRIFRHIHDLDELVPLAAAARRGWDEAGERFGRRLVDDRGALLIGGPRDRYAASLAAAGIAHALLEPDDLPPQLAPLGLAPPLATSEHRRVTFDGTSGDGLPCVLERSRTEPMTGYLTPLPGGGVSLGTGAADDLPDDDAVALTAAYLSAIIPGADPAPTAAVRCRSVVLAGHTEALGLYRAGGVAAFAGGNLFKHAPALGPLVAEALLEGRVDPLLTPP